MATDADRMTDREEHDVSKPTDSAATEDLEEYGVWVKVGPEDIQVESDTNEGASEAIEADRSSEGISDSLLTEEEEGLLGDLEDSELDLSEPEEAPSSDFVDSSLPPPFEELPSEDISMGNGEDELGLEDLGDLTLDDADLDNFLDDENALEDSGSSKDEAAAFPEMDDLEIGTLDEEGESLADASDMTISEAVDEEISSPDELDDELTFEDALPEIEDLGDLDFDVDLEVELEDLDAAVGEDVTESIPDLVADEIAPVELEESDSLPGADEDLDAIDLDELKQSDFGEELAELELDDDLAGVTLDDDPDEIDLPDLDRVELVDDVGSLEDDLISLDEDEVAMPVAAASQATSESVEALHKIELELRSIKEELSALKSELSSLRTIQPPPEPAGEPVSAEASGFFDDDDETIALTGDELDNILNTVDITEEPEQASETLDDADMLDMSPDLLGEDASDPPVEDIDSIDSLIQTEDSETIDDEMSIEDVAQVDKDVLTDEADGIEVISSDNEFVEMPDLEVPPVASGIDLDEFEEKLVDKDDIIPLEDSIGSEDFDDVGELDLADVPLDLSLDEEDDSLDIELDDHLPAAEPEELAEEEIVLEALNVTDGEDELEEIEELSLDIEPTGSESPGIPADIQAAASRNDIPEDIRTELKTVLTYLDQLLESLPEDKIHEFAQSEHFDVYKKLFEELGLAT